MEKEEKVKIRDGFVISLIFLSIIWIVKLIEISFDLSFVSYGLKPRTFSGLKGIFTAPLIHSDLTHLFNNSVPLLVSMVAIVYFFRKVAFQIMGIIYVVSHFIIWIIARDSYHIGASGLVYGFMSFMFFSSTFSKNKNMMALALIIVFLYGAMVWGILPVDNHVSWESHLMGALVGFVVAIFYRNHGPKPEKYDWEDEEDDIDEMSDEEIDELIDQKLKVKYWYKSYCSAIRMSKGFPLKAFSMASKTLCPCFLAVDM